jgi:ribosomal protein L14
MGTFISKPSYVDFGFEASTKKVKFNHNYTTLTVASKPSWVSSATITYGSTKGEIEMSVGLDATQKQLDGLIEITANDGATDFTHYIRVIYSFDSEHISLGDVVDVVIEKAGETSFIARGDRRRMILVGKRWLQDNRQASGSSIRFAELAVENGKAYPPADYIDYMGAYVVSSDGYLKPLFVNNNINIASSALKDSDNLFLLDQNGLVISSYGLTDRPTNENPFTYYGTTVSELGTDTRVGLYYNVRGGELSSNGLYRYDTNGRCFVLDGVSDDFIVVKYASDPIIRDSMGIESGGIRVHKNYQEALEKFIYKELIDQNRNVPLNEKMRAERDYKLASRRASAREFKGGEILQALRSRKGNFSR